MESSPNELIRYVEANVLDQEYKRFPFFRRPSDLTIPYLLRILGSVDRGIDSAEQGKNLYLRRTLFQTLLSALSHSLRWISIESKGHIWLPPISGQEIEDEAKEAIEWAFNYSKLVLDHVAWSRGVVTSKVDEFTKTISFEYSQDFDPFFLLSQAATEEVLTERIFEHLPTQELRKEFQPWIRRFTSNLTISSPSWQITHHEPAYHIVFSWLNRIIWPEVLPETDLGGYTLNDYRRLQASLFLHGFYFSWLEGYLDARYNFEKEFNSAVIADTEYRMIMRLSEISGVQPSSVRSILNDLTFDATYFHSSLSLQPFVRTRRRIYLLARLIPILDLSRMLASSLTRGKKRLIYDKLVQLMEQANLDKIEFFLKSLGFVVLREKRIVNSSGSSITPDFLVFDIQLKKLLIIDYKHTLAPMGVSDAVSKSRTIEDGKEGLKQLRKYIEFLKHDGFILQDLGFIMDSYDKIYGLLLFRWPMALPVNGTSDIQIIDWVSLSKVLSSKNKINLSDLLDWIKHRPDLSLNLKNWKPSHQQIKVGDWTYNHLILLQEPNES